MRGMRWAVVAACALAFAGVAEANGPTQRTFPVLDQPSMDDRYPDRVTRWAGGVISYADVVYQSLPGYRPQVVDVYVPATKGLHPLVLYIHGGRWAVGHTRQSGAFADFPKVLAALAAEGFTVASLEYRLSAEAKFPAQLQDAKAALRFLSDHAARYRIDPKRIGVWGGSAGGHLAALTALTCHDTHLDPQAAKDLCPSAAVTWYGVFDAPSMIETEHQRGDADLLAVLGCVYPCPSERAAMASPVAYIDADDPPFLLIHGTADKTVPVTQSQAAEVALRKAGVPVQAIYIDGVDHSFVGKTAAETRNATLKAVNATFDFLHRQLDHPRK